MNNQSVQEDCAANWSDLIDRLYAGIVRTDYGRHRSPFIYRGMSDRSFDLSTSLMRLQKTRLEGPLLRAFRKYASPEVIRDIPSHSVWNWLALAQHHGLPTRLLDWTMSPLVAIHFATDDMANASRDGVIWCVNVRKSHALLPPALKNVRQEEQAFVFTTDMLERTASSLEEFDRFEGEGGPFLAFLEPPSFDERIVNQYAMFSVISSPIVGLDEWARKHPELFRKVIIPATIKPEVRDKLDHANITERMLYPGLDGLCRWLKRYYS